MDIDERTRRGLYLKLEEVLGADDATTLMAHLPPLGWGDVATKADLANLQAVTKADLANLQAVTKADLATLEHRLTASFRGELNAAITSQTRTIVLALVGVVLSMSGLSTALALTV